MNDLDNSPECRKNFIGASDAPAIMGVSPWCTPYQKWEEKVGVRQNRTNEAQKRGILLEEEARKEFERQTGLVMFPERFFHPKHAWMCATLDGIDIEHKHILEIKCPGKVDHECAMDGQIPEKYIPQLMHQMYVTGIRKIFYFSYHPTCSNVLEMEIDPEYTEKLFSAESKFWDNVISFIPPELSERDFVSKNDDLWSHTAHEWIQIHNQIEALKQKENELRESLISMCGSSNSLGNGVRISKVIRRGNIEYKKIPELNNVDLEKYRKSPIESWRIAKC